MTSKGFSNLLKGNIRRYATTYCKVGEAVGLTTRTMVRHINNPGDMTVSELQIICRKLHIRDEDIIEFIKHGKEIGNAED